METERIGHSIWRGCILLVILCLTAGGCQQISALATLLEPPTKFDAVFKPAKDQKILVLVEDRTKPTNCDQLKRDLTEKINKDLMEHKVAKAVVSYDRLQDMAIGTTSYNSLSIGEIGQRLNADLVLYVQIENFGLKDDAILWHGRLETQVWVVDVKKGRLWPKETLSPGYEVPSLELKPNPDTDGQAVLKTLTEKMGQRIARLFYDYQLLPEEIRAEEKDTQNETFQ